MLGNCIHLQFNRRWSKPSVLLVLSELALNIFCIFGSFNAFYTASTPIIKQQLIVILVYYLFNFISIAFMYMDEGVCMYGLVIELLIYAVYLVYSMILHFHPESHENIGWGYGWITLILTPYMVACLGFVVYTITHMKAII